MLDYLSLMDYRIAVPLGGNLKSISVALNFKVAYGGKHPYNYVHQFFQEASRTEKKYPCIHVFKIPQNTGPINLPILMRSHVLHKSHDSAHLVSRHLAQRTE